MEGKTSMLAHFIQMYGTVVCAVYYNSSGPIQAFVLGSGYENGVFL